MSNPDSDYFSAIDIDKATLEYIRIRYPNTYQAAYNGGEDMRWSMYNELISLLNRPKEAQLTDLEYYQ